MTPAVPSPCRKICELSPDQRLCIGCGRTVDEIARWIEMTPAQRREASRAAAQRLANFARG